MDSFVPLLPAPLPCSNDAMVGYLFELGETGGERRRISLNLKELLATLSISLIRVSRKGWALPYLSRQPESSNRMPAFVKESFFQNRAQ